MKTCADCKQRVQDVCVTHLKRVQPHHVACVYHAKTRITAIAESVAGRLPVSIS